MIIYPLIELENGRCCSHLSGADAADELFHVDPVDRACAFAAEGAAWLHVTDLDAARGNGTNEETIRTIIRKAGVPVQVSGGIRTLECVTRWIDAGAGRVAIATAAVTDPEMVRRATRLYPDWIALAVSAWKGRVMAEGRTEPTSFEPLAFIKEFEGLPLAAIIFTDLDRDLEEPGSSVALTSKLASETAIPVISSGLVKTLDDLARLHYVYNISGTLVGRALFKRTFTLPEALSLFAAPPEPVAEFM